MFLRISDSDRADLLIPIMTNKEIKPVLEKIADKDEYKKLEPYDRLLLARELLTSTLRVVDKLRTLGLTPADNYKKILVDVQEWFVTFTEPLLNTVKAAS